LAKREISYQNNIFLISYEILNRDKTENMIFLHGWGSSKQIMKQSFSPHFQNFKHIYIDLIGFGESGDTNFPLTSFDYFRILDKFLTEIEIKKDYIFGHSFGGKIATLLNPANLILLSSAGIIQEKSLKVKLKIALYKFIKKIGFSFLQSFFISADGKNLSHNMYETFKNVVDENFENVFANRKTGKTYIFWGISDSATPLDSGQKIHKLIFNSAFFQMEGNHFFFLDKVQLILHKLKLD